jgi:hypothetical protein
MKKCTKCEKQKNLDNFYKASGNTDRVESTCKLCKKQYYEENKARLLLNRRKKYYTDQEHRDRILEKSAKYKLENQEKVKSGFLRWLSSSKGELYKKKNYVKSQAYWAVEAALKKGEMQRESCADCGYHIAEAHHEDYSKPLEVTWLCRKCHAELHKQYRKVKFLTKFNYVN